jgi:hypothetical protein
MLASVLAACSSSHAIEYKPSPSRLSMPSINVDAEVVPVSAPDGVLEVPPDPRVVGWWSGGAQPGDQEGSVVLDVHLDSVEHGFGPFAAVHHLEPGDPAQVVGADGSDHDYTVVDVVTYEKTVLPHAELFRRDGPPKAVLVTCGGEFDPVHGWDSNVVVVMEPA